MKVYKFGGASVKSAQGVKNLKEIIGKETDNLVVVVSAMGKVTNMLEAVTGSYFNKKPDLTQNLQTVKNFHYNIVTELYVEKAEIEQRLGEIFAKLEEIIVQKPSLSYDFEYDRIVSFGEILSTTIVSDYLNLQDCKNIFVDVRTCLKSDDNYREGNIEFALSEQFVRETMNFSGTNLYITQGFIAGTITNQTTTLGREGSDYTATLLASMLDAENVTIWKDVPGVMNADPNANSKLYSDVKVIPRLSYKEAIELSYCGASIIHPKTVKPLKNKKIPLFVRSFAEPDKVGSVINDFAEKVDMPPIYINKANQVLFTLTPRDFSFIAEEKLSSIFSLLASYKVKVSLIQTSAISFSLCIDYNQATFNKMISEFQDDYEVLYNTDVELITIRHYTQKEVDKIFNERIVFVEQRSRLTVRFVVPAA
ncbi:MAG: aspartate kinase [Prevotellaceae bacterium]|jgi:aspartate kinase|nr:aspartate kinase [Prevotellaceae bacterium]